MLSNKMPNKLIAQAMQQHLDSLSSDLDISWLNIVWHSFNNCQMHRQFAVVVSLASIAFQTKVVAVAIVDEEKEKKTVLKFYNIEYV